MSEQPPTQDTYTLVLEAIVAIVLTYFFWTPLQNFFGPIVHSLFAPLWQALGL